MEKVWLLLSEMQRKSLLSWYIEIIFILFLAAMYCDILLLIKSPYDKI